MFVKLLHRLPALRTCHLGEFSNKTEAGIAVEGTVEEDNNHSNQVRQQLLPVVVGDEILLQIGHQQVNPVDHVEGRPMQLLRRAFPLLGRVQQGLLSEAVVIQDFEALPYSKERHLGPSKRRVWVQVLETGVELCFGTRQ